MPSRPAFVDCMSPNERGFMSTAPLVPPPLAYAEPHNQTCPLCTQRPVKAKYQIYGHPVCKKCYYAFANRRQLGYLVDGLLFLIPSMLIGFALGMLFVQMGISQPLQQLLTPIVFFPIACIYVMKDGFKGQSPGKMMMGTVALDEATGQPIGFKQSFKRNSVLLLAQIPFAGPLVGLVIILIIAFQVAKGYRLGDRFAQTKVIWKKYADQPVFGGKATVCESCGYDLRGNSSGTCPECGKPVSATNAANIAASGVSPSPLI